MFLLKFMRLFRISMQAPIYLCTCQAKIDVKWRQTSITLIMGCMQSVDTISLHVCIACNLVKIRIRNHNVIFGLWHKITDNVRKHCRIHNLDCILFLRNKIADIVRKSCQRFHNLDYIHLVCFNVFVVVIAFIFSLIVNLYWNLF